MTSKLTHQQKQMSFRSIYLTGLKAKKIMTMTHALQVLQRIIKTALKEKRRSKRKALLTKKSPLTLVSLCFQMRKTLPPLCSRIEALRKRCVISLPISLRKSKMHLNALKRLILNIPHCKTSLKYNRKFLRCLTKHLIQGKKIALPITAVLSIVLLNLMTVLHMLKLIEKLLLVQR